MEAEAVAGETVAPETRKPRRKSRVVLIPIRKDVLERAAELEGTDQGPGSAQTQLEELRRAGRIIEPPFELSVLAAMGEYNADIGPVIEAMETNVVGFGWSIELAPSAVGTESEVSELPSQVEEEWERFNLFFEYGNWGEGSFTAHRRNQRRDFELMGMAFQELIATPSGEILGYVHSPAQRMRLTVCDDNLTTYTETVIVGRGDRRRLGTVTKRRRFRRFVQVDPTRSKVVFFKEFDDPRPISRVTGDVLTGEEASNPALLANPMMYRRIYAPRTPYGVPRYIGNMLAILGGRCAEEVNYATFRNNQIPSMMILVSGGQLTDDTIERLTTFSQENLQGDDNRSRFLVIEAEPDPAVDNTTPGSIGAASTARIDVKPLKDALHDDAMFVEYEKSNRAKIRRCWRLPPILVGDSDDYSRMVAETSRRLTEEQVFEPERREEDSEWARLVRRMGMSFHNFKSNSPNVTNDDDLIKVMATAERSGAMTPRIATRLLTDILGFPVPPADVNEIPADIPFSLTMAEKVKNLAKPNEVGQQVTALKSTGLPVKLISRLLTSPFRAVVKSEDEVGAIVDGSVGSMAVTGEVKSGDLVAVCTGSDVVAWVEIGEVEEADGVKNCHLIDVHRMVERTKHKLASGDGQVEVVQ